MYGSHTVAFDIIMFILDNLESLCYDYNILSVFFPNILKVSSISRQYGSHTVAFDIIMFILDNLESLCYDYNILSVFFPNILKVGFIFFSLIGPVHEILLLIASMNIDDSDKPAHLYSLVGAFFTRIRKVWTFRKPQTKR